MKKFLHLFALLFCLTAIAQNYTEEWEKVLEYEAYGRVKPANEEVEKIYALAKKDKNEPQIVKTFFFLSRYSLALEEEAHAKILRRLKDEQKNASIPTKALLESIYAELLQNVYQKLSYNIRNRTTVDGPTPENIAEWGGKNYLAEIELASERSISNWEVLYNTPLSKYDAVIDINKVYKNTNRSLYDFLAERRLEFIKDGGYFENYKLNKEELLLQDTPHFLEYKIPDSINDPLKEKVELYQKLERLYSTKNDSYALQRAVLRRLEFMSEKLRYDERQSIYLETINHYAETWDKESPFLEEVKLKQIQLYVKLADKKNNKEYYIKAVALCNDIIQNTNRNDIISEVNAIKEAIIQPLAKITTEKYTKPNKPILAKVNYKNTNSANIKIYKVYYGKDLVLDHQSGKYMDIANTQKPLFEKNYTLPSNYGYFEYETEIILPSLSNGVYLASIEPINNGELSDEKKSFFILQTTDINLLEESSYNTYTVANRVNGKPIKRAKIIHDNIISYTDKNGRASINTKESGNQDIVVIYNKDTLSTNGYLYTYNNNQTKIKDTEYSHATTQVYLDRAIYRPGQTVYFKGIVTEEIRKSDNQKSTRIVPDIYLNIEIEDGDNKVIKKMRLKTNEFGSFTGEFTIPGSVMTGTFSLNIEEDDDYEEDEHPFWDKENLDFEDTYFRFRVEEYKRPTFETYFNPFTDVVKINDSITVTGKAAALNGSPLIGAKVRYNISRTSYAHYNSRYNGKDYMLKGEVITDNNGNFKIPFVAVVDTSIASEKLPVFTFSIDCEVTDITGETHECDTRVYVGYHSLQLNVMSPAMLTSKSEEASVTIKTENLNNQFVPAECDVKIYKLTNNNNKRILHRRPWSEPEIQTIPESEFIEKFPHTPYKEVSRNDLPREKMVFSRTLITKENEKLSLEDYKNWETGEYELYITTKDSSGNILEEKSYFSFKKEEDLSGPYEMLYEIKNTDYNKDGYVALQLYTALPELYVNIYAVYNNGLFYTKWHKLTKGNKIVKVPVNKKWKGKVSLFIEYVWENEYERENFDIKINSAIEPITFHTNVINNKLLPGKKETWSFTLKNSNELPAEVLASMYDSSLDQFEYSYWNSSLLNSHTDNYLPYKTLSTRGLVNTNYIYSYLPRINIIKPIDFIKTYGLDINNKEIDFYTKGIKNEKEVMNNGGFILTGTVSDKIGPLPNASVYVKGTLRNVQTDIDGNFSIPVVMGETLDFGYVSFSTVTMVVNSTMPVNIILEADELSEAIVDYYSTPKRTTAAVTTLSVVAVEDRANASIIQSLQGQVAGLEITTGSGQPGADTTIILRGVGTINGNVQPLFVVDGIPVDEDGFRSISQNDIASYSILKDAAATSIYGNRGANGVIIITTVKGMIEQLDELEKVESRKNLQETAFFYPQILTDKEGNFNFTFTSPEALTRWNFRLLAHNKKAQSGYFEYMALTQKDLMIMPNMPRFLREGDEVTIKAKVTNMTAEAKTGNAMLQLYDAATMQPIDKETLQTQVIQPFNLGAKANTTVSWTIKVPLGLQGIQYKVVAKSGDFSDGEENIIPVLTNRTLVTESIPLWVKGNTTKEYTLENLKNNSSSTLVHHGITLEYTSNPAWIALQSLPYLMEFEHECAEQVFSRYYANAIATHVLESNPKIAEVFDAWRKSEKPLSKLEQNEELKSIIMAESPWMLDNQNEEERKNRLALLFELDKMKTDLTINLNKLDDKQLGSGGYAWFDGGKENEFITRHIMAGLGHLNKLGIVDEENTVNRITKTGVKFIDDLFWKRYKERETDKNKSKHNFIYPAKEIHYHYARSFYLEQYPMDDSLKKATQKYLDIYKENWLDYSLYEKGLTALVLHRYGEKETAKNILQSLKDTAAGNNENGMYWIGNKAGWYWYNSPIETQALLIEAFAEIANDNEAVNAMKVWLIKNKQNKSWSTTKSTTEAVYALMMTGSDWLSVKDNTTFTYGEKTAFDKKVHENEKEAGTGYIKLHWQGKEITKDMATLTIENKTEVPGYGGLYWQYFEDTDKVKTAQKGLMNIKRELYIKANTADGTTLKKVTADNPMKIGDKVTMRLVLNIKEDMEYVHLKDVRAAAFEPVDVISKYEYKDGLGYYRSTRDAATHFFFDRINKGTYVLEYDVRVNNAGEFSNGISTIQSMYAPEFSGHSEGIRIKTEQ